MIVDISDVTSELSAEQINLIDRLVRFVAKKESVPKQTEVSINFVDEREIQSLNFQYRNKNEPTDVISFAMQETITEEPAIKANEKLPVVLGDIVISIDQAKAQAKSYNHSFKREICFLTVHGLLHLLGYNHLQKTDEHIMFQKQNELLQEFGIERT